MNPKNSHKELILTALWAMSESGMGGLMHAFKLPFTGFFLGGFAIVILSLLARISDHPFRSIIQATILVVLIKAAASPHSPPMAYLAVAFQGLLASVVLFKRASWYVHAIFGALALFESAIQKFITATLIFGKSIWDALDGLFVSICKDLGIQTNLSFSLWLIGIYSSVYVLWGGFLGLWAYQLYQKLGTIYDKLSHRNLPKTSPNLVIKKRSSTYLKIIPWILVVVFLWIYYATTTDNSRALYVVWRTFAAVGIMLLVVLPLVNFWFKRLLKKQHQHYKQQFEEVQLLLPEVSQYARDAYQLAREDASGIRMLSLFIQYWIALSLHTNQN